MKINAEWLKNWNACKKGKNWFFARNYKTDKDIIQSLIENKKLDWANWAICRLMNNDQKIK